MNILVTGGAGFIGSFLVERLLYYGHRVIVLDNLSTGSKDNLKRAANSSKFEFYEGDIRDFKIVAEVSKRVDCIYHLAASVGVKLIVEKPIFTLETNISGFSNILRCAVHGKKKVLLASSSEVYGKNNNIPLSEDSDTVIGTTTKRRWSYACSKIMDEFLALAYWQEYEVPIVICRFFNIIGPRQRGDYGMVVPRFITQALSDKPLTVYGDGTQTRCFLNVNDLIDAITVLMEREDIVGEIFNIGSDREVSINSLASIIVNIVGSKSRIEHIPFNVVYGKNFEDMERRVPDITKIKRAINFSPKYSLEDTLLEIVEYIRNSSRV